MTGLDSDPAGFGARLLQYRAALEVKGHTADTIWDRVRFVERFAIWCEERGLLRPTDVTAPVVERYQRHLYNAVSRQTQKPLKMGTQGRMVRAIRDFYRWLVKQRRALYNPAGEIELPRREKQLPRNVPTPKDVESLMTQPDIRTARGLRDRAILELLYSTGLRRFEAANLELSDVQPTEGVLNVRQGKGKKDRYVPIGERAGWWLEKYLAEGRPQLAGAIATARVFLSRRGDPISKEMLGEMVRRCLRAIGIPEGACHALRHACATHMHDNGADIRYVQAMLGHSDLSSTEIYTRVAIKKLREIHARTHPAAQMKPNEPADSAISRPPD